MFAMVEDDQLEHVTDRAFNDRRYFVDSSKIEKLGWTQEKDWTTGLVRTSRMTNYPGLTVFNTSARQSIGIRVRSRTATGKT